MSALFPKWSNSIYRWTLSTIGASPVVLVVLSWALPRMPYFNGERDQKVQPVKFDHRHHVRDDGIDCRYCHSGADRSAYAGVPAASTCMNCHAQVWVDSPELAPVRASYYEDTAIPWRRVNSLPDFVFFNHSIHVAKGVGCVTCHGRVDEMAEVYQARKLTMAWCLDCHRAPERYLRPPARVADMEWRPESPQDALGLALRRELAVEPTTDCTGCHR